jgi:FkbM family methyltransferase
MIKKHNLLEKIAFSSMTVPLIYLFGNKLGQEFLEVIAHCVQHLMGVGSGSSVKNSGERVLTKLCKKYSNKPYVVFDVGVNTGEFIDLVLKDMVDEVVVYGFEPSIDCYESLIKKYKNNRRVALNNIALGAIDGEGSLYANSTGSGSASMTKPQYGEKAEEFILSQPIKITTVDQYCKNKSINEISLLKIDVEGHDFDVLRGSVKMLRDKKIKVLSFEFCAAAIETRIYFRDIFEYLTKLNYEIYRITRSGYIHHVKKYNEKNEIFRTTNFVAIRGHQE